MALTADQLRAYREFFQVLANIKRLCLLADTEKAERKEPAREDEFLS